MDHLRAYRKSITLGWMALAATLNLLTLVRSLPTAWLYGGAGFCAGMAATAWVVLAPMKNRDHQA